MSSTRSPQRDPLVIMVIIEPTKDQQAAFEAEDAAREDLTGE